jgi:hypothetical protein
MKKLMLVVALLLGTVWMSGCHAFAGAANGFGKDLQSWSEGYVADSHNPATPNNYRGSDVYAKTHPTEDNPNYGK